MSSPVTAAAEPAPEQQSSSRTVAVNSAWLALEAAVGLLGGLAASVAVARVLGPEKVGYFSYLLWAVSAVTTAASLGVPGATRKFAAEYFGAGRIRAGLDVFGRTWRVQAFTAVAVAGAALAVVLAVIGPEHRLFAALGALAVAPTILLEIPTAASAAAQQHRAIVIPAVISSTLNLVGVGLCLVLGWDLPGLAASLLLARILDMVLRRLFFARVAAGLRASAAGRPDPPAEAADSARIRRFCLHAAVLQVLYLVVWDRSEVFFLERFCPIQQVAFYAIPFSMTSQALIFARTFSATASVNLMTKVASRTEAARAQTALILRYLFVFIMPLLFGLAALSYPIVRTFYGSAFEAAAPVTALLAVSSVARAALTPLMFTLAAFERQGRAIAVTLACAVLNVALDVALIPSHGALGAAVANGIAQLAAACGIYTYLTRSMGITLDPGRLLRVAAAAAGCVLPAAALSFTAPPLVALAAGFAAGVALYPPLLKLCKAPAPGDGDRVSEVVPLLPAPLRAPAARVLEWVTRPAAQSRIAV